MPLLSLLKTNGKLVLVGLPEKLLDLLAFPLIMGMPITMQDAKGKEWTFQFKFWPNNNSKMYVLEVYTLYREYAIRGW
ncbi:unnamed protein product [Cuscuta campestris]|uniref:TF-B3 domain-containing protein n=1 Tax=Cuscuta campestris TaxID=132261 RepID=A0A484LHQ2_9ASTE|nr:unnamed protein product [Cuscuta campestris]